MGVFGKDRNEQLRHLYEVAAMLVIALLLQVPTFAFLTPTERTVLVLTPLVVGAVADFIRWRVGRHVTAKSRSERY